MDLILSVLKFLGIFLEVLLIFNLLIVVHELGHFWAAKWRGLYIERFGVWFGKPLWEKKIGGVWYSLGSIPFGGFVKLPQLAPMEALEGQTEIPKDQLKPISARDKIIVAFAGPLFSFLLAFVFAVLVWQIGRPMTEGEGTTIIGRVEKKSPAEQADLKVGDEIVSIDNIPVKRFAGQGSDSILWRIVRSEGETIKMVVKRGGQELPPKLVKPELPDTAFYKRKATRMIGIAPAVTPRVAAKDGLEKGGAGEKAGLQGGDLITHVNGQPLYSIVSISDYITAHPGKPLVLTVERGKQVLQLPFVEGPTKVTNVVKDSPAERAGLQLDDKVVKVDDLQSFTSDTITEYISTHGKQPIAFTVERAGKVLPPIQITPAEEAKEKRLMIGVGFAEDDGIVYDAYGRGKTVYPGPGEQLKLSAGVIFSTIDAITSRKSDIGVQHMGGPVMMMNMYYRLFSQEEGWKLALWFSVLLNVNLAMLNMLPLPVLDGGHITLAIIESIRRKPANLRLLEWVQTACALVIIGFMLFVTFYDVQDVFGGGRDRFHYANPAEAPK